MTVRVTTAKTYLTVYRRPGLGGVFSWPGKSPIRCEGIGGVFGVFAFVAAGVSQVGVGEFVGDDPADEIVGAAAERALEDHTTAGPFGGGGTQGDVGGEQAGLVVAKAEGGVGDEIA